MLNLADLGIETPEKPEAAPVRPRGVLVPDAELGTTLREAERRSGVVIADFVADLGVRATALLLRDAINQIWARNPAAMPFAVIIAAAPLDGATDAEALDALLMAKFPARVANRILEVVRRRALAFLDTYPAWQARLADEGVKYPEMERRGLRGEFDVSGPLKSRFDLSTMSFPEETR